MAEPNIRRARLERLLEAARKLQDPHDADGQALRRDLLQGSGLSAAGIELGLRRCLETRATEPELELLLARTPEASAAHVLLSGNVFVAALRAIVLASACAPRVFVRASRRDPFLARALQRLVPDAFELVSELQPRPGDHAWGYGSDATLESLRATLPRGVWWHGHGHGLGAVVLAPGDAASRQTSLEAPRQTSLEAPRQTSLEASRQTSLEASRETSFDASRGTSLEETARAVALDTALFDQRGCLSPRAVYVVGNEADARAAARSLAAALSARAEEIPLGPQTPEDLSAARSQRDAARYACELFDAGPGWVSLAEHVVVPPPGRNLHVAWGQDPVTALTPLARHLTCLAISGKASLRDQLVAAFPGARHTLPGRMQSPPLDGPVDLRSDLRGERSS